MNKNTVGKMSIIVLIIVFSILICMLLYDSKNYNRVTNEVVIVKAEPITEETIENTPIPRIEPKYAYTMAELNVRRAPSKDAEIVETLHASVKVLYEGEITDEWVSIRVNDMIYYINSEYLSEEEPAEVITLIGLEPTRYVKQQEEELMIFQQCLGEYTLTAYCACEKCCGKWSKWKKTASGTTPEEGRTVACVSLDFGTVININGENYIVEDTGNLKEKQIDIYFESHQDALEFGRQKGIVYLIESVQ